MEPRPQGICTTNFVTIGPAIPENARGQTDTQTDRQTHTKSDNTILHIPSGVEEKQKYPWNQCD